MYAYFDIDEGTVLEVRRRINTGEIKPRSERKDIPVLMGLQGENGFPHQGLVNFVNNKVDPSTGTIMVRGVFDNPKPEHGTRILSPGMFVRIRLPIGVAHPCAAGRRRGDQHGPRAEVLVPGRRPEQGRIPRSQARAVAGRRAASCFRRFKARRVGRDQRLTADSTEHDGRRHAPADAGSRGERAERRSGEDHRSREGRAGKTS